MSFFIDLALVFVLALCVYIGWVHGFVKTLSGFLTYVVSFAVANATYRFLSVYVMRLPFLQKMDLMFLGRSDSLQKQKLGMHVRSLHIL